MDQYANCGTIVPKCAISQLHTMNSQRSISNELQHNAKIDLILILKKCITVSYNSYVSLRQRKGNTTNKVWLFFWLLINWFGFFLNLF